MVSMLSGEGDENLSELYDLKPADQALMMGIAQRLDPLGYIVDAAVSRGQNWSMAPIPMQQFITECEGFEFRRAGVPPLVVVSYRGAYRTILRQGPLDNLQLRGLDSSFGYNKGGIGMVCIQNGRLTGVGLAGRFDFLPIADIEGNNVKIHWNAQESLRGPAAQAMVFFADCTVGQPGSPEQLVFGANIIS